MIWLSGAAPVEILPWIAGFVVLRVFQQAGALLGVGRIWLTVIMDQPTFGPAMRALTEKQRNFVVAMLDGPFGAHYGWAQTAGYEGSQETLRVTACRLLQQPKIQAACLEMGQAYLHGLGPVLAASGLLRIAANPDHPKHFAALESVADRVGILRTTEHRVLVDDARPAAMVERIRALAKVLGVSADALLGVNAAPGVKLIEGEASEVASETVERGAT